MKHKVHLYSILAGCLFVISGFILPWYHFSSKIVSYGSSLQSASGWQLWLGGGFFDLNYAPNVLPAFFAFLWMVPLAALVIGSLSILEQALHWKDRWLYLEINIVLLVMQGIFLGPALLIGTLQFGLFVCLSGWLLILFGVLAGWASNASEKTRVLAAQPLFVQHSRRGMLRGLVGIVGFASIVSTGGFLFWKTWRTHTSITTYRYWDANPGLTRADGMSINTVDWSPDGKRLLVAQLFAPPQSWNAFTGEERRTYQPAEANGAAWSPDGQHIALSQRVLTDFPFLTIINAKTGVQEAVLTRETSRMNGLGQFSWSPDGQYLVLADEIDLVIKLWKPFTETFSKTYTIHTQDIYGVNRIQDVICSPNGRYLTATIPELGMYADGSMAKEGSLTSPGLSGVYIWDTQSGDLVFHYQAEIPSNTYGSPLVSWSPDSKQFACANKTTVQIVDLALQKPVLTYTGHALEPTSVAWSPDGKYLASSTYDWTVQVWESATGMLRFLYQGHTAVVTDVAWSPDGKYLASCGNDGTAQVWQPEL